MAYDDHLEDRLNTLFSSKGIRYNSKKMMGGLCYMVNDKMCVGIVKENLMARIGPEAVKRAIKQPGCKQMDFTGRPMKAFVYIEQDAIDMDEDLEYWVDLALEFNPKAKKSSKKKK